MKVRVWSDGPDGICASRIKVETETGEMLEYVTGVTIEVRAGELSKAYLEIFNPTVDLVAEVAHYRATIKSINGVDEVSLLKSITVDNVEFVRANNE